MKKILTFSIVALLLTGCRDNDHDPLFDPEQFIGFCALFSVVFSFFVVSFVIWLIKIEIKFKRK